jgi:Putative lumazine-binding
MPFSQPKQNATTEGKTAARETIEEYLAAVKTWNEAAFRETFHPGANISHYYVKGDTIKTITLDEFVATIASLHKKFDNAEEVAEEMEVTLVGPLASVRVAFAFVMGPNTLRGQDLFNLAFCQGKWRIVHKTYYL